MAVVKDAMKAMESIMSDESIDRSNGIYERELLRLNLAQMDLDMEIKVRPRKPKKGVPSEVLLFHT